MTRYCLLWDNHNTNLALNLTKLYEAQQHLDMTLRCENTDIGVHKCVLMAGSLYFEEQFRKNANATIVIIKSMQFKILKLLIEFIYKGEIYVEESDVPSILLGAKYFQISGLSGINSQEVDPIFENVTQLSNFEEPEFLQTEIVDELDTYKTERPDLNTLAHESNEKTSIFLQDTLPKVNLENENTTSEIVEGYFDSETKIESQVVGTSTTDENVSNVPEEEHFEDEEYLEEHLENFDEESLVYPEHEDSETNKALQVLQEAGVPTDVPIYCEGNDGSFVELTKDILEEIASGGQVIYQVVDEEGKAGELLLGTTVKHQSRVPTPQSEISTNVVYDKLVSETLYTPSPTPSLNKIEPENGVSDETNTTKEEPLKMTRERKVNSRYFNSNLTSPFLELSQRKAQKRTHSSKEQNKIENIENSECDLIEQKIAELHADFPTDLTNYMNTIAEHRTETDDKIPDILNDNETNVKFASKHRKNKRFLKLFDSPKMILENTDECTTQIITTKRRKTKSETSDTSSQSTTSKEIPYALGLLPLRKALKKIQNMPDHTPRKTRSNVLLNKPQQ